MGQSCCNLPRTNKNTTKHIQTEIRSKILQQHRSESLNIYNEHKEEVRLYRQSDILIHSDDSYEGYQFPDKRPCTECHISIFYNPSSGDEPICDSCHHKLKQRLIEHSNS